jgi:hypothetical protein
LLGNNNLFCVIGYDPLAATGDSGSPCFNSYYAYGILSGGSDDFVVYMAIDYLSGIDVSLLTD